MKVAIASDHAGYFYKEHLKDWLISKGIEIEDFGAHTEESSDYPDFGIPAAQSVASNKNDYGLIICGTGTGMCIAANKVDGVRAANCWNAEVAKLAREHNNANVLNLGARVIDLGNSKDIIEVFLNTAFLGGRHERRVNKLKRHP